MAEESKDSAEGDIDKTLLEHFETKRNSYKLDMIKYKALFDGDHNNDYYLFLYLGSIMNFIESHNEGCLSPLGMKSLELDISYIIKNLNTEGKELDQKDLVRLSLNVLASYAVCVLVTGMISFSREEPKAFFQLNPFPTGIQDDFEMLQEKALKMVSLLKNILDVYTVKLDSKHRKVFNEEKVKGFVKQIYDESAIRIGSAGLPSSISQAKAMN
jgi:hypothetical protein